MPRSHSLAGADQPSTSSKSSKSAEDMRAPDGRCQRKQKKISKIGRSYSSPVEIKSEQTNIDLLSSKPNGRTMEDPSEEGHENKTPIRWMWKKALKSLKTKDKDKSRVDDRSSSSGDKSSSERDDKRAYSRMNSRQSSLKKGLLKRKDSKEQPVTEEEPELSEEVAEIDPVYSLLKCAADLPRQNKGQQHTCCLQRATDNLTVRVHSGSTSPSSGSTDPNSGTVNTASTVNTCSCPCHTPEVLASYHLPLLNSFIIKKS